MATRTALSVARRSSRLAPLVRRSPRTSALSAVLSKAALSKAALSKAPPIVPSRESPAATGTAARSTAAATTAATSARPTPGALRLAPAKTGDHASIHRLLVSVFHGPSAGEFHAQLDEPGYEPADRLVVKDGEEIAAHLRLARQTIQVGELALPAARFMDLATAQEYRGRGLATALLAAGERQARERGVLVGLTRTRVPSLFARQGWTVCGRHLFSSAAPRQVLAELGATSSGIIPEDAPPALGCFKPRAERISVRPLRRIELPALIRLYEQNLAHHSGAPRRSHDYWDWLLARGACDRIFVAATLPEPPELPKLLESIVGYAFVRGSRLVEVITAEGRADVARHLAARVCADASEQNEWLVRCDAPPTDALHTLFRQAGGRQTCETSLGGEVFMARLLDPFAALQQLAETLHERAKAAELRRPFQLGLELRSAGARGIIERFCLKFDAKQLSVTTGGPCRHTLILRYAELAALLLEDCTADAMLTSGRLKATTRPAKDAATALFCRSAWWRPLLDDLLA